MSNSRKVIDVIVLDDHPLFRYALELHASHEQDVNLTASFGHSRELIEWLDSHSADVVIVDYMLHGDNEDGLTIIKDIYVRHPEIRILLSSSNESTALIQAAFKAGVKGYITKRENLPDYFSAIKILHAGGNYISPMVSVKTPKSKNDTNQESKEISGLQLSAETLTPREAEVLSYFIEGLSNKDIAQRMKKSQKTISTQKTSAMKKLGLVSDLEIHKYRNMIAEHLSFRRTRSRSL